MQLDSDDIAILKFQGHALLKILLRRQENVLNRIYGLFVAGEDVTRSLSEYCAIREQIAELQSIIRTPTKEKL